MKNLYLIRHSAALRLTNNLDSERELSDIGINKLTELAPKLQSLSFTPNLMIYSTAMRTKQTALHLHWSLKLDCPLVAMDELYNTTANNLLDIIKNTSSEYNSLAVIGHNPSVTELANILNSDYSRHIYFNPANIAKFSFYQNSWKEIKSGVLEWLI